ncbi:unnamed protein product [Chironomus riparius]|uniref:Uncharacterized protein n=1 Tax=Chironomus riparius TaxID=315576 RepID=A0A9N9WU77_9DIPT|nr:unnamed protein product [Chironomus riparius]
MSKEKGESMADKKRKSETINIIRHVGDRLTELKKIYNDVNTRKSEMLIHQLLPNHIRRRGMSHNPKRLPKRYRAAHINQMQKSGLENKPKKRPSRKYRRRPANLMKEYCRRKLKNVWLETHIWHAKRFKMKDLWGYKVPYSSTNKRYRASYKAIKSHCLIQDISYYSCIEVTGELPILTERLSKIASKDCGLTLTAKCYLNGTREGQATVFKKDSYPYNAIAQISFIWKQNDESRKTIWIFVHPSAYKELLKELIELFETVSVQNLKSTLIRNPKYLNSAINVEIIELKDTLNRYRLTGPFSNSVITKTFSMADKNQNTWLKTYINDNPHYAASYEQQVAIYDSLRNTSSAFEYQTSGVLSLIVTDPRTNRLNAQKIFRTQNDSFNSGNYVLNIPKTASCSPLWNKELRDEIFKTKLPNSELNKLRNEKQLLPAVAAPFEKTLQPIPIILIQRGHLSSLNDRRSNNLGDGWDIIVPAGYGLSTWLSLIKFGARVVAGFEEENLIMNEMKVDIFQPDTVMGIKEYERIGIDETEKYFKKPPNKRINYRKFKISSPFSLPFMKLINEWRKGTDDFYILRNKSLLNELNVAVHKSTDFNFDKIDSNALIPIFMTNNGEYRMSKDCNFGLICLPRCRDIKRALELDYTKTKEPILIEESGHDETEGMRKNVRFNHKKLLKRLRNRRVKAKRKLQAVSEKFVKIQKSQTKDMIEKYFKDMCDLWLPSKSSSIRHQCSREVIGYISKSYFRFTDGKVCAIGYLTCDGLKALMDIFKKFKKLKPFVLTRATNSKNYFKANFHVNF